MEFICYLEFDDLGVIVIVVVVLMVMLLMFSISEGIVLGFIIYVGVKLGVGKYKEISVIIYLLVGVFILWYLFGL